VRPAIDITTEGGELVQRARLKSDLWLLSSASSVLTFRREWSCVRASLRHATTNTHVTSRRNAPSTSPARRMKRWDRGRLPRPLVDRPRHSPSGHPPRRM